MQLNVKFWRYWRLNHERRNKGTSPVYCVDLTRYTWIDEYLISLSIDFWQWQKPHIWVNRYNYRIDFVVIECGPVSVDVHVSSIEKYIGEIHDV